MSLYGVLAVEIIPKQGAKSFLQAAQKDSEVRRNPRDRARENVAKNSVRTRSHEHEFERGD